MTNHPGLSYRPDIDGLRAIAVLAVIIFHIHPDFLRGGFAGVDIFFVISGFLITSILRKDLDDNKFSLAQFYERRARRILPALITVLTITLGVFSFIFFPADLVELGQSTIAAALSVSNIFFWRILNYFATAATEKPLLHTWSLGVEEQFYLIFPILLFYLDRYFPAKKVAIILSLLGLTSFIFATYAVSHFSSFAFYQLPSRFGNSRSAVWSPISRSGNFHQKPIMRFQSPDWRWLLAPIFSIPIKFPSRALARCCLVLARPRLFLQAPTPISAKKSSATALLF